MRNREVDDNGKEFSRNADGSPFRGIDVQLKLGLISPEKHAFHLKRGTYGCVTPAPPKCKEIFFPHRWFE